MSKMNGIHALDARPLQALARWDNWKKAWKRAETAAELDGLLHVGIGVALGAKVETEDFLCAVRNRLELYERNIHVPTVGEAVAFYLEIADGYPSIRNFHGGGLDSESEEYARAGLSVYRARKAAKVLASTYFAGLVDMNQFWLSVLLTRNAFHKTLWFFRRQDEYWYYNLPKGSYTNIEHYEKTIRQVPTALARVIVLLGHDTVKHHWLRYRNVEIKKEDFVKARSSILDMLHYTGNLEVLSSLRGDSITTALVEKLLELARKDGKGSFEKALLEDSPAAKCLAVWYARRAVVKQTE